MVFYVRQFLSSLNVSKMANKTLKIIHISKVGKFVLVYASHIEIEKWIYWNVLCRWKSKIATIDQLCSLISEIGGDSTNFLANIQKYNSLFPNDVVWRNAYFTRQFHAHFQGYYYNIIVFGNIHTIPQNF